MPVSFGGLASGIDSNSLIDGLVKAESIPITRLQTQQKALQSKSNKLGSLNTKLKALETAATALSTRAGALPTKVTSSDTAILTATSTGGSTIGSFNVVISKLAAAERTYSDGFAARDQTGLFGSGKVSIQVGTGTAVEIETANDTLDSLASKINSAGLPVTAGVFYDGSVYRLQIAGTQTGTANALTFVETGTSLNLNGVGNTIQEAQNAELTVDTFPVNSASNTITSAIPGVTLQLLQKSPAGTTQRIDAGRDPDATQTAVQTFVSAYNDVASYIASETAKKGADSLMGDSTVREVQGRLRRILSSAVSGRTGAYTSLASVGVSVDRNGTMSLDATKFRAAMSSDSDAVADIFSHKDTGISAQVTDLTKQYTSSVDGVIAARTKAIGERVRSYDKQIEAMQLRIDKYEERLRAQFAAMEKLVSGLQAQGNQLSAAANKASS